MTLNSKSYLSTVVFSFVGFFFAVFWILIFIGFVFIGTDFSLTKLVLLPILIIPLWILFIIQNFLNRLKFKKNGVTVYKILFLKYKYINWTDIDYSFHTIERGKNGSSNVLYLVKNKSLVLRISESNYKNYTEINNYITSNLDNKGFMALNFFESFKYLTKGIIYKLP